MDTIKKKAKGVIEVSTFAFAPKGPSNRRIKLSQCILPLREPVPGYFSGLHGYANKNEAMMLARQYAATKDLHMLTVNLYLLMSHPLKAGYITEESLPERSLVSTNRLSRALVQDVAALWKKFLQRDHNVTREYLESIYKWDRPEIFVADHPRYVAALFRKWRNVQVISHNSRFTFTEKPVVVATFKPTKSIIVGVEVDPSCSDLVDTVINDLV